MLRIDHGVGLACWARERVETKMGELSPACSCHNILTLVPCSRCYSPHGAYAQSKLALVLFSYYLQHQLSAEGSAVTANVVDPGVVDTDLYRHVFWGTRVVKKLLGWLLFKVNHLGVLWTLDRCVRMEWTIDQCGQGWKWGWSGATTLS